MADSSLKLRIQEDMKAAMRAHDSEKLSTIRMLLAAMKQIEVDERIVLDDARILSIIDKLIRQRQDSIEQFKIAGRDDLVKKETQEIAFLKIYLPEQLSEEEVKKIVVVAISEAGAKDIKDMGKVMAKVKAQVAGRADMGKVGAMVKAALSGG